MAPSESLQATETLGARGATHPRVSLADIEAHIDCENYLNAGDACERVGDTASAPMFTMTLCFLTMKNGYVVIGKSAPASPENYDAAKGRTFAREDAIRQLWPLMAFSLRDELAKAQYAPPLTPGFVIPAAKIASLTFENDGVGDLNQFLTDSGLVIGSTLPDKSVRVEAVLSYGAPAPVADALIEAMKKASES